MILKQNPRLLQARNLEHKRNPRLINQIENLTFEKLTFRRWRRCRVRFLHLASLLLHGRRSNRERERKRDRVSEFFFFFFFSSFGERRRRRNGYGCGPVTRWWEQTTTRRGSPALVGSGGPPNAPTNQPGPCADLVNSVAVGLLFSCGDGIQFD